MVPLQRASTAGEPQAVAIGTREHGALMARGAPETTREQRAPLDVRGRGRVFFSYGSTRTLIERGCGKPGPRAARSGYGGAGRMDGGKGCVPRWREPWWKSGPRPLTVGPAGQMEEAGFGKGKRQKPRRRTALDFLSRPVGAPRRLASVIIHRQRGCVVSASAVGCGVHHHTRGCLFVERPPFRHKLVIFLRARIVWHRAKTGGGCRAYPLG